MIPWRRSDFPLLERDESLIYLDSAATALKPAIAIQREQQYATDFTANIHRSNHLLADMATEAYENARVNIAAFLNAAVAEVIFVRNATEAVNLVAAGLPAVDRVLISASEHHSNIVPWMRRGAPVTWIEQHPCEPLTVEAVAEAIQRDPRNVGDVLLLTFAYASNVTGVVNPAPDICRVAREHGVLTCVDASQAIAHLPIDMAELDCDFLAFSGHKIMGPTGIGVLVGRQDVLETLEPLVVGGGAIERVTQAGYTLKGLPHRFEAGTPHISGAIGLAAAIGYLQQSDWSEIARHEAMMAAQMDSVFAELRGQTLMAKGGNRLALGSIAFPQQTMDATDIARMLSDQHNIMVRAGFHCTHPLFDTLGLNGALRVSPYIYNTSEDIGRLGVGLHMICKRFT